jgi:two-component system chemotaxis sensor kinase CheA
MTSEPDAELREAFREDTTQRLDEMDAALVAIESGRHVSGVIDSLFRNVHTIKGTAGMFALEDVTAVAHAAEDILSVVRDEGAFPAGLLEPMLHVTSAIRARVNGDDRPIDALAEELGGYRAALRQVGQGEGSGSLGPGPPGQEVTESAKVAAVGLIPEQRAVRVASAKIDHMLNIIGEAVQDERRLAHALGAASALPESVADALGATARTMGELKDTAVKLRTLPLAAIVGPLPRMVRDLARAAGKDVDFTVLGADIELDRVILESLVEPVTHLLRNAIAHGIEDPVARELAGKPTSGRIELRAVPRGGRVEVTVADDGRGVSPEVAERALRAGSLADVLADPGYSTASEVTELAGRGVGLDAVRNYAQSLGGTFEVRSQPGRGMEVILLLPLALVLLNMLLFERGGGVFGVPLAAVEEVVTASAIRTVGGRPSLSVRGHPLPAADVAELLGAQAPPLVSRPQALVIAVPGRRVAVICDALLGEEEVVVKPLGPLLAGVAGYLGAAILGSGRIALLAEPAALTRGRRGTMPQPARLRPSDAGKILVVEDSFTVRELQRGILEAAGYQVVTARHGNEALRLLGDDPGIALIVTDLDMPELGGLGLTRAVRADPARSALPVVIITARGSPEDQRQGIEAGADAYMTKHGFDQQALLATVNRLIGR